MSALPARPDPAGQDPPEAAGRLFADHSERLLLYCLRQLRSRPEAEDAVQTTFLYAFRALRRGVVPECESAWLTTIAKNVCHSQRRTVDRRGPLAGDVELEGIALAQTGDDEEELLLGFKEALASMPEKQRRALVRREWQGVPAHEIARELEMSATATHALLTRARHSFAQALTLPGRPVAGVLWLILELRSHMKALLGGVSTKAAVTSIAVLGVGVGVGGVAVDRSLAEPKTPPVPGREAAKPTGRAVAKAVGTVRPSSASSAAPRARSAASRTSRAGARSAGSDVSRRTAVPIVSGPYTVVRGGTPEPSGGPAAPAPELPAAELPAQKPPVDLPVHPPVLPEVELPTQLVPPVELPPLPTVGDLPLPPLPPVDLLPVPPLPSGEPALPVLPLP